MEKTTVYINSYYSDVDWRDEGCTDGVYKVTFPKKMNIQKKIEHAYKKLEDEYEPTNELSCMLDYLIETEGEDIQYECIDVLDFNCDYGSFRD